MKDQNSNHCRKCFNNKKEPVWKRNEKIKKIPQQVHLPLVIRGSKERKEKRNVFQIKNHEDLYRRKKLVSTSELTDVLNVVRGLTLIPAILVRRKRKLKKLIAQITVESLKGVFLIIPGECDNDCHSYKELVIKPSIDKYQKPSMRSLQQLSVNNDALHHQAAVNGIQIIAEYDTGSSGMFLSRGSAESLKTNYEDEQQGAESGDGSATRTPEYIDTVVKVGKVSSKERIYIMEDSATFNELLDHVIVLGRLEDRRHQRKNDWDTDSQEIVRKHGIVLTISRRIVRP